MSRNLQNQNVDGQPGDNNGQEIEWLAFRYVSDEMSKPEREQFEKRLETASDAQTALVDVMQQTQLLYAALGADQKTVLPAERSTTTRRPLFQRQSALIATAAAALLLIAGWSIFNGNQDRPGATATAPATNAQNSTELALVWANSLSERELELTDSELDELVDEFEMVDFSADISSEDWMLAALEEIEGLEGSAEVLQ